MLIIFCSDPLNPRRPDEAYEAEINAAKELGLLYALVNYEALVNDDAPEKAVQRVPETQALQLSLYRGWMLTPDKYSQFYDALAIKGLRLINDPAAYRHCHYLPESYSVIHPYTPKSVWMNISGNVSLNEIMHLLRPFGSSPVVLKDFVKSQKHYWEEACFIPSALDRDAVERVVRRFIELQGESLNAGLVFREFVEFEPLTKHSKSGMPLTMEFRIFFLDGEPLQVFEYWEEGDYGENSVPLDQFRDIAKNVQSRFFTMDVARRKDGRWLIVELGDAQVAGLPEKADARDFYKAIMERWPTEPIA